MQGGGRGRGRRELLGGQGRRVVLPALLETLL